MFVSYVSLGFDPSRFWSLCPAEIAMLFEAATERLRREHDGRAWQAHTTAMLTAYPPEKSRDFTKLDKLLSSDKPAAKPRRQTWQEQLAITKGW